MNETATIALERIYLIGLSGSGKSTISRLLAERIGWAVVDLDDEIVATANMTISELFAKGEAEFRRIEHDCLMRVVTQPYTVVATGGGVVVHEHNRTLMQQTGTIIFLEVQPDIAAQRVTLPDSPARPLLQSDPAVRLAELLDERGPHYAIADITVNNNLHSAEDTMVHIIATLVMQGRIPVPNVSAHQIPVAVPGHFHTIHVACGALHNVSHILADIGIIDRYAVVTDTTVANLYLQANQFSLADNVDVITIPAGEENKQLATVTTVYDHLIDRHHERGDAIIALGGGVVGDLAGFAAATYLRGVPVVQVPTTLLAQVDSSIGGKTGVNHPAAKNIIGAFYQPQAVIIDPLTLLTLTDRIYREGWGEIVKTAMILDADLFRLVESQTTQLLQRRLADITPIIARCAAIKAQVIAGDEREGGKRILLNYGHTIGHALETVAGYGTLLHGEAVFIGMAIEARIAARLDLISVDIVARQDALIQQFLPTLRTAAQGLPIDRIMAATTLDKKAQSGTLRWVLPTAIGAATVHAGVPSDLVRDVLQSWQQPEISV